MERALGFGLKYRTPLGPIRLDFAFNLRRAAEQNFLIQIGIGNVKQWVLSPYSACKLKR